MIVQNLIASPKKVPESFQQKGPEEDKLPEVLSVDLPAQASGRSAEEFKTLEGSEQLPSSAQPRLCSGDCKEEQEFGVVVSTDSTSDIVSPADFRHLVPDKKFKSDKNSFNPLSLASEKSEEKSEIGGSCHWWKKRVVKTFSQFTCDGPDCVEMLDDSSVEATKTHSSKKMKIFIDLFLENSDKSSLNPDFLDDIPTILLNELSGAIRFLRESNFEVHLDDLDLTDLVEKTDRIYPTTKHETRDEALNAHSMAILRRWIWLHDFHLCVADLCDKKVPDFPIRFLNFDQFRRNLFLREPARTCCVYSVEHMSAWAKDYLEKIFEVVNVFTSDQLLRALLPKATSFEVDWFDVEKCLQLASEEQFQLKYTELNGHFLQKFALFSLPITEILPVIARLSEDKIVDFSNFVDSNGKVNFFEWGVFLNDSAEKFLFEKLGWKIKYAFGLFLFVYDDLRKLFRYSDLGLQIALEPTEYTNPSNSDKDPSNPDKYIVNYADGDSSLRRHSRPIVLKEFYISKIAQTIKSIANKYPNFDADLYQIYLSITQKSFFKLKPQSELNPKSQFRLLYDFETLVTEAGLNRELFCDFVSKLKAKDWFTIAQRTTLLRTLIQLEGRASIAQRISLPILELKNLVTNLIESRNLLPEIVENVVKIEKSEGSLGNSGN